MTQPQAKLAFGIINYLCVLPFLCSYSYMCLPCLLYYLPPQTMFMDSTAGLDIKHVANNAFVQFQVKGCAV
jgi:hypothetical protein